MNEKLNLTLAAGFLGIMAYFSFRGSGGLGVLAVNPNKMTAEAINFFKKSYARLKKDLKKYSTLADKRASLIGADDPQKLLKDKKYCKYIDKVFETISAMKELEEFKN